MRKDGLASLMTTVMTNTEGGILESMIEYNQTSGVELEDYHSMMAMIDLC